MRLNNLAWDEDPAPRKTWRFVNAVQSRCVAVVQVCIAVAGFFDCQCLGSKPCSVFHIPLIELDVPN